MRDRFHVICFGAAAGTALAYSVGCGYNAGRTDAGLSTDASTLADASGIDSGGTFGDGNDNFDDAVDLVIDGPEVSEGIRSPGDHDFYRFTGAAGQWLRIFTRANPMDDPDMLDTVITMYGPDSTAVQVAENDDAVPRSSTDSEIMIRLPANGAYYLEIQDYTDWTGTGVPDWGSNHDYTISVIEMVADDFHSVEATDPGNDVASATAVSIPQRFLSKFDAGDDIDVYSFTMAPGFTMRAIAMPDGPSGYGSTADIGDVWITDAPGTAIIARVNAAMGPFDGPFQLIPPLQPGDYLLFVERQPGPPGLNDFWVGKIYIGMNENPREREAVSGENDTIALAIASAETVVMVPDGAIMAGYVLAELSTDADVDVFGFNVPAGHNVSVGCGSAIVGSGVLGLSGELRRADDSTIATASENLTMGLSHVDVAVGAAGSYYLRLAKLGQDPVVTGTWVRCAIFTFVP